MFKNFQLLNKKLIVSSQAEGDSPFNSPQGVTNMAIAAVQGGAAAIRTCGVDKTEFMLKHLSVPIIGLTKAYFPDNTVCITGRFDDVKSLVNIGTPIIAVDGTFRIRENSYDGPQYIAEIKRRFPLATIMADISTLEEALACKKAGADCVSTTLCGYTPETIEEQTKGPSFDLLSNCVKHLLNFPVFAEGRYNTPEDAAKAIALGAWSVVVGSAITRPHLITQWYVDAISKEY